MLGHAMHGELEIDPLAAAAVARPVSEHERGQAGIANQATMGSAIAQTQHGIAVQQHLTEWVEVAVAVIQQR